MEINISMNCKINSENKAQLHIIVEQRPRNEPNKIVFNSIGKSDVLPIENITNYENTLNTHLSQMAEQMLQQDGMFTNIENLLGKK